MHVGKRSPSLAAVVASLLLRLETTWVGVHCEVPAVADDRVQSTLMQHASGLWNQLKVGFTFVFCRCACPAN
jgi:hypothetical protein